MTDAPTATGITAARVRRAAKSMPSQRRIDMTEALLTYRGAVYPWQRDRHPFTAAILASARARTRPLPTSGDGTEA
jgi:hypothetical protein